jgi:hypothetical protein
MSITTYEELKTAIQSWQHRSDLNSVVGDFVTLAEAKFNRRIRARQQEADFTGTPTNYEIAIPADFLAVRKLWRTSDKEELVQKPLDVVRWYQEGGESTAYAIGDAIVTDGTSALTGVYFTKIAALSASNTTNWLLTAYPDVYLFAGLAEVAFYVKDKESAAMWTARADSIIAEINRTSHKDQFSGPVRVVAR